MEGIPLSTLGAITAIFAGFFALIKYVLDKQATANNKFLEYIEKKNGHMERIAKDFTETVKQLNSR